MIHHIDTLRRYLKIKAGINEEGMMLITMWIHWKEKIYLYMTKEHLKQLINREKPKILNSLLCHIPR
jgi:hypothetical protein